MHLAAMTCLLLLAFFSALQTVLLANIIPSQTKIDNQGVTDFTYVHPFRSTSDGSFLSHDLSFADDHLRGKRSFADDVVAIANSYVTLDLNIDNHPLRLVLDLSYDINLMMSPNVRVAEDDGDVIDEQFDLSCFHVGHVMNYSDSNLAISSCGGVMTGLISFNQTEYAIEPESQSTGNKSQGKRHVFYRRSSDDKLQIQRSEGEQLSRYRRRSPSLLRRPRYFIETMILLDSSVMKVVGKKFVKNYIVMMMARVNEAFHHPSLKFDITVYITDIIKLSKSKSKKLPSENKSELLAAVCNYRRKMNPKPSSNPRHSDAIVYLTRNSFESFEGHSHVGRMCADSCSIVQDQGSFTTASIVAHEIGHLLSMGHDDDENCGDNVYSVMSSTIRSTSFHWSSCSNKSLKKFLLTSQSSCLKDRPHLRTVRLTAPSTFPGRGLSRTNLCRQAYGLGYKMYKENARNCEELLCVRADGLCSIFRNVLDGTTCGTHMECRQNKCVKREDRKRP